MNSSASWSHKNNSSLVTYLKNWLLYTTTRLYRWNRRLRKMIGPGHLSSSWQPVLC